jgi:ABC-type uncharacterized transport system permease subunit
MNKTHIEHLVIAIILQLVLIPFVGAFGGGLFAISLLLGREISQHEYKLVLSRGWTWGQTMSVKWYEGLTTGWSDDSILDIVIPMIGCLIVYGVSLWII